MGKIAYQALCGNSGRGLSKHRKTNSSPLTVEALYVVLLTLATAAGWVSVCSVMREQEFVWLYVDSEILSAFDGVLAVLAEVSVSVFGVKIYLATRYRQYDVTDDAEMPFVSIIIPAYNEGKQVLSTVNSVMASEYKKGKFEVVCIDDGSTDDTWMWMTRAKKEFPNRIKLVRQPRNMGKRHALLAGFKRARGKILVTLDSDSEILPQTLRNLISPFVKDSRVGAVAGNVRVLNVGKGSIPKMLDVSFTLSFDFFRRAQSVYGGVLCTPGALSAYRAKVIKPFLPTWANQTFLGKFANIGEDRALSNIVLRQGYRVVFQKNAFVLTMVPEAYQGLCRMLLRWARSNVRESLMMAQYLFTNFRKHDSGGWFLRLSGFVEIFYLPLVESLKLALVANLALYPVRTAYFIACGCVIGAILPAVNYQFRNRSMAGVMWSLIYVIFQVTCLSWISFWGLVSAGRSGWLTRGLTKAPVQ